MNAQDLIDTIDWDKVSGLIPVIVQDVATRCVLMLGYMNAEAIRKTFTDHKLTFFSRTKQRLWQKGETSGHTLEFVSANLDCDQDTLLVQAKPLGPTCHMGSESCFGELKENNVNFLLKLESIINSRKTSPNEQSYTSQLFAEGINKIAQKVGEEGVETVIAGLNENDDSLVSESADLIYHLLVLLRARNIDLSQVMSRLESRHS